MLKLSLVYFVLSLLFVLFAKYIHLVVVYIDIFYTYLHIKLSPIFNPLFNHRPYGHYLTSVLLLVFIPVLIAGVPALIYRLIKGKNMPYFIELTWCIWLIIVLSKILIH